MLELLENNKNYTGYVLIHPKYIYLKYLVISNDTSSFACKKLNGDYEIRFHKISIVDGFKSFEIRKTKSGTICQECNNHE